MTHLSLIPVFNGLIQNQPVQLCNARELHAFLEIQTRYNDWIKNRINEYGFIQDEDYLVITERTNGRPRKEYHITLDMGKELRNSLQHLKRLIKLTGKERKTSSPNKTPQNLTALFLACGGFSHLKSDKRNRK